MWNKAHQPWLLSTSSRTIFSSIKGQARELLRSLKVGIHVLETEKRAHRNRTKRLRSIPADLSMPRAHTSELDRLRLCQRTDPDLRGLSSPEPTISLHVNVFVHAVTAGTHVAKHVHRGVNRCAWIYECVCLNKWLQASPAPMAQWFCSLSSSSPFPLLKDCRHYFVPCF